MMALGIPHSVQISCPVSAASTLLPTNDVPTMRVSARDLDENAKRDQHRTSGFWDGHSKAQFDLSRTDARVHKRPRDHPRLQGRSALPGWFNLKIYVGAFFTIVPARLS